MFAKPFGKGPLVNLNPLDFTILVLPHDVKRTGKFEVIFGTAGNFGLIKIGHAGAAAQLYQKIIRIDQVFMAEIMVRIDLDVEMGRRSLSSGTAAIAD